MLIVIHAGALWSQQSQTDEAGLIMLEIVEKMTGKRIGEEKRLPYVRAIQQAIALDGDSHWYAPGALAQALFSDLTGGLRTLSNRQVRRLAARHQSDLMAMPALQPGVERAMTQFASRRDSVVVVTIEQQRTWVERVLIKHEIRIPVLEIRESPMNDQVLGALRRAAGPDRPAYFVTHQRRPYLMWAGEHSYTRVYFPQHADEPASTRWGRNIGSPP